MMFLFVKGSSFSATPGLFWRDLVPHWGLALVGLLGQQPATSSHLATVRNKGYFCLQLPVLCFVNLYRTWLGKKDIYISLIYPNNV